VSRNCLSAARGGDADEDKVLQVTKNCMLLLIPTSGRLLRTEKNYVDSGSIEHGMTYSLFTILI
jgi:hypothetical protein